jgi:hypothetical protein
MSRRSCFLIVYFVRRREFDTPISFFPLGFRYVI